MRIDRLTNFPKENFQMGNTSPKSANSFQMVMQQSQQKLEKEILDQKIKQIDILGQRLVRERTFENLSDYKRVIKSFVEDAVRFGLQLSEKHSFDDQGNMKMHQIVEVIDEKLLELNDSVLAEEKDGMTILRLVGEIKGLIVNLYM